MNVMIHFNSHPHEEDDRQVLFIIKIFQHFNSHPHEEDDIELTDGSKLEVISTHILTKRMTL